MILKIIETRQTQLLRTDRIHEQVDKSHLLRFGGLDVATSEHHVQSAWKTNLEFKGIEFD